MVLLFYAAATMAVYWPVFLRSGDAVFATGLANIKSDVNMILWILSWVAHALATAPSAILDGNALYPAPYSLAHSEHLIGLQPFFAPLYYATGNPVAAMQGTLFLIATTCGAAMYALLRSWGVPRLAALLAGLIYAFFPGRYFGVHEPHHTATHYLPLVLLFLDRTLSGARRGAAVAFGVVLLLQLLCSFYLAFVTLTVVAVYGAMVCLCRPVAPRGIARATMAGAVAGALLGLVALPYYRLASTGILPEHPRGVLIWASADPLRSYLYPPIAVREWGWSLIGLQFYLGVLPLVLALAALLPGRWGGGFRWRVALPILAAAAACWSFSMGPGRVAESWSGWTPYAIAQAWIPGFAVMRVPGRFAHGVLLGVAALAGLGAGRLLQVGRERGLSMRVAVLATVLVTVVTAADFGIMRYRPDVRPMLTGNAIPPVYRALAGTPPGAVLEIPADARSNFLQGIHESEYAYYSTYHWKPLLNGYTGYWPPTYAAAMRLARALPDPDATRILTRIAGLRFVVVHTALLPVQLRPRWLQPAGMRLVARYGSDALWETNPPWTADRLDAFLHPSAAATVLGNPTAAVAAGDRRARVEIVAVRGSGQKNRIVPGQRLAVELRVANRSRSTWPALSTRGGGLVGWLAHWDAEEDSETAAIEIEPLPYDLAAGASLRVTVAVAAPAQPGHHELEIGVGQAGEWFEGTASVAVDVEARHAGKLPKWKKRKKRKKRKLGLLEMRRKEHTP